MNVEITPFDNDISILYKWATVFGIPKKYVGIDFEMKDNKEYLIYYNGIESLRQIINTESLSEQIDRYPFIPIMDIMMLYSFYNTSDFDKLTTINQVLSDNDMKNIRDDNELKLEVQEWLKKYRQELISGKEELDKISQLQDDLSEYDPLYVSPLTIEKATLITYPILTFTGEEATIDDGVELFNKSIPNFEVPYIRYNGKSSGVLEEKTRQELFKLYKGKTIETRPNYPIVIPPETSVKSDNNIYLSLWTGSGNISKATKESFVTVSYDLDKNKLTVKAPVTKNSDFEQAASEVIVDRLKEALPIQPTDISETSITGYFYIYGIDIDDTYLLDLILNDSTMSSYLFVKEDTKPYALKKQLKLYYKTLDLNNKGNTTSSVIMSINQSYGKGGEVVNGLSPTYPLPKTSQQFVLRKGDPYIRVKITMAESRDIAEHFMFIFSTLLNYYNSNKETIEKIYTTFIPELIRAEGEKPIKIVTKSTAGGKVKEDSKMERLKREAGELFIENYSRIVQIKNQPIIIPFSDIEIWKNKKINTKGKNVERPVLPFPIDNPKWYFTCEGDNHPFIGVIENTTQNKNIYPCLPKCFKKESSKTLSRCKPVDTKVIKKGSHKVKTEKILDPNRIGLLPNIIVNLIDKYSTESNDIVRMGMPHTVNSLLHCVLVALEDDNYTNLETSSLREEYVIKIRNLLTQRTFTTLYKQELYDYTDDEIFELLSDSNTFLDPNLFYRGIEEMYNINLYVLSPKAEDGDPGIEYPRFKLFHAQTPRPDKKSILIYRTWGSESDNLKFPQCEIIVDRDEDAGTDIKLFDTDMTKFMYNVMLNLNRTISWMIFGNNLEAKDNLYSRLDYYNLFNRSATGQLIDGYGKMRGLVIPVNKLLESSLSNEEVTIIFPSSQPENLMNKEPTTVSYETAMAVINSPVVARTVNKNGLTDGLWFSILDLIYGIYIPIIPEDISIEINIGPDNPLISEGTNISSRLFKMKRDLELILQITIWLFLLSNTDVNNFANKYTYYGTEIVEDSSTVYDLSNIGNKFPIVKNYEEGVEILSKTTPSLFYKDRLFFYSRKFFDGVMYYLSKYNIEVLSTDKTIPTTINRSMMIPEDFDYQQYVAIFVNKNDMSVWLETLDNMTYKNLQILEKLDRKKSEELEPYIYASPTKNMYLVQNVLSGDLGRAAAVSLSWYIRKINMGYETLPYEGEIPVHVIYGISPSGDPVLLTDNSSGQTNYLQMLDYGGGNYASLLRLL